LQPIMGYTLVRSMIGGLQMFDLPYLYHSGANFSRNLETVAVYIYYNFNKGTVEQANYGYAGAASIIIFAITAVLGSITFYMNRDKDEIAKKQQRKRAEKQQKARMKQGGGLTI
ncbi:MAG: sugar ABC transporter permease, partial [Oscillospiraceae bacterium]|nr:sugar ABC transporter permease [Oscillospiraceae bacterium]